MCKYYTIRIYNICEFKFPELSKGWVSEFEKIVLKLLSQIWSVLSALEHTLKLLKVNKLATYGIVELVKLTLQTLLISSCLYINQTQIKTYVCSTWTNCMINSLPHTHIQSILA